MIKYHSNQVAWRYSSRRGQVQHALLRRYMDVDSSFAPQVPALCGTTPPWREGGVWLGDGKLSAGTERILASLDRCSRCAKAVKK